MNSKRQIALVTGASSGIGEAISRELLKQAPLILLCLGFDDAGKKRYAFWMKLYPNLRPWPIPHFKSPGDAFEKAQINILNWIKCGLSNQGL